MNGRKESRQLFFCIAILLFVSILPLTSASVLDVRQNFPEHIQGDNGIYLQYRSGPDYVDLINYNPFGEPKPANPLDYIFVNPDMTDSDHFPVILAYEYNNPNPSTNQISAAPSCKPRNNVNADAVMRITVPDNGGLVHITGSCNVTPNPEKGQVYFTIYKGAENYASPAWSTWNNGSIDVTVPYSKGEQLFFSTNSGTDTCLGNDLAYWTDLKLDTQQVSSVLVSDFSGIPTVGSAPLDVVFKDVSTGIHSGWAWFFGDETYSGPWTQQTASAGWTARAAQSSVVLPDGTIVLMGGYDGSDKNDVWRSKDQGATWTKIIEHAEWSIRELPSSVVMPDGSIILAGGTLYGGFVQTNDVWRSVNGGETWTLMNASAGWSQRYGNTLTALDDGSIILTGGYTAGPGYKNDVWKSVDNGATWTMINASTGWSPKIHHTCVAMHDGSLVVTGGWHDTVTYNDVWRSTDSGVTWAQLPNAAWTVRSGHTCLVMPDDSIIVMGGGTGNAGVNAQSEIWRSIDRGTTWTEVTANAGWPARAFHTSELMPDGSVVLMAGEDNAIFKNDVWRFNPVMSSLQNPSHTYSQPGTYSVALQVYNTEGYNSTRKTGYITVTNSASTAANITAFSVPGQTGTAVISSTDQATGTVTLIVPYGTDRTSLVPTFTVSDDATAIPLSGKARDFTYPVTFVVTAADGTTTKTWTVTVIFAPAPPTTNIVTPVKIVPKTINLGSKGYFFAFVTLPDGYASATFDTKTITCSGAPVVRMIRAKMVPRFVGFVFKTSDLKNVQLGKKVTLTVAGKLNNKFKTYTFAGSDTINVISKSTWQPMDIKEISKLSDDQLFKTYYS
jgi:PKD repeat protein